MRKIIGFLRLMRPPNIITALADVLAGVAIAGSVVSVTFGNPLGPVTLGKLLLQPGNEEIINNILLLLLSTACLYGGGVVLNDVFDAALDKRERPERPIPSGLISKKSAAIFGVVLLAAGIVAAAFSAGLDFFSASAVIAMLIAGASVIYDKWSKHNTFFGPLNMGVCRGLNLLLGMSLFSFSLQFFWFFALAPVIYIAAITMISRGEVSGGNKKSLFAAAALYILVLLSVLIFSFLNKTLTNSLPLVLLVGLFVFPPLQAAAKTPTGPAIGKAVKNGILALILLNAAWAAAFGDMIIAGLIFLLLPFSYLLSRLFAVT